MALLDAAAFGGRGVQVLTGGHFDGALCVSSEAGRTLHVALHHSRTITCVALASNGVWLLTGAVDTTVVLWELQPHRGGVLPQPLHTLRGHVRELTAAALSSELGLAASGAADGCVLLHTCHNGTLVRSVAHPDGRAIGHLLISAVHCRLVVGGINAGEARLHVFSMSGVALAALETDGGVRSAVLSPDGALVIVGGVRGDLVAWRLDNGARVARFEGASAAVSCACIMREGERAGPELLVGTQEGDVLGYGLDPASLYGAGVRDVAGWAG